MWKNKRHWIFRLPLCWKLTTTIIHHSCSHRVAIAAIMSAICNVRFYSPHQTCHMFGHFCDQQTKATIQLFCNMHCRPCYEYGKETVPTLKCVSRKTRDERAYNIVFYYNLFRLVRFKIKRKWCSTKLHASDESNSPMICKGTLGGCFVETPWKIQFVSTWHQKGKWVFSFLSLAFDSCVNIPKLSKQFEPRIE